MRDEIGFAVLANWVSMLRADVDGAIWLVEDDDEARFYERLTHPTGRVVPAPQLAIPLLDTTELRGVKGVVATIRGVRRGEVERGNVFYPTFGDVASLLMLSRAFANVLSDIGGQPWLTAFEKMYGPMLDGAVSFARLTQRVRDVTPASGYSVSAPALVDWGGFGVSWDQVTATPGMDGETVNSLKGEWPQMTALTPEEAPRAWDGMDAAAVVAEATRMSRPRGLSASGSVTVTELLRLLRVAFLLEEFETDDVFWRMKEWERRNRQFALLKEWRSFDPLGVVYDQRYWRTDLESMVRLLPESVPLALLKIDLDNFKLVNETLGHGAGDEALHLYCSTVKDVLGGAGEIYRRGGDEVVVIAPGLEAELAQALAEKLRQRIEIDFRDWGQPRGLTSPPTVSIGLVMFARGGTIGELHRLLDEVEARAKETKNCVVCLP
jgi:diguanylate cyclase (GGDEF)-like protein